MLYFFAHVAVMFNFYFSTSENSLWLQKLLSPDYFASHADRQDE